MGISPATAARLSALLGLFTALVYGWVWRGLHTSPLIIDESAYLLQSQIFAGGHWTAPARPLPEFFEQLYVFVFPFLAAKYPPGHPLLLALGQLAGSPAIVVLLLNALSGALVFYLATLEAGILTGSLTWVIWLLAPINLTFRPSYLSNVTTGALWLLTWLALERWWQTGRRHWLLMVAGCVGWCIVTRPLTGLVLAIPVGIAVLRRVAKRRLWKDFATAVALGALVAGVLPFANRQTTGRWFEMPWTMYARLYTPYDHLGFGFDSTSPQGAPGPGFERLAELQRVVSQHHTVAALPSIAWDRLRAIVVGTLGGGATSLIPAGLVGLLFIYRRTAFALACSLLLIVVHLTYAHQASWTPYYLETLPAVSFVAALGLTRLSTLVHHPRWRLLLVAAACGYFTVWLVGAVRFVPRIRSLSWVVHAPYQTFRSRLLGIADRKAVVFVRDRSSVTMGQSLVFNVPDLEQASAWIVHDLGSENRRLLALAPDRAPFLYDAQRQLLIALPGRDTLVPLQRNR